MAMTEQAQDEQVQQELDLLGRIETYGHELHEHTVAAAHVREELYPLLYEANVDKQVSLARLQQRTGLTRGRIHQIVNLMKARKAAEQQATPALPAPPAEPVAPMVVVERQADPERPRSAGWGV